MGFRIALFFKDYSVGQDYVNEGEKVKFAFDQRLNPNERTN